MFNADSERQQGEKTEGAYEGGQAGEMEELWKNDWRRAAGEEAREERQMVWGKKGRRDSKTRNRQWSRWIDFAGSWLGGIKNVAGLSCQWKLCLGDIAEWE